jgi:hypothetical protein
MVLANVNSFWIRTEMHTGDDVGGIDDVYIGTTYISTFDASSEGWSSGGDGTMEWMSTGGYSGGFLQISDWAIGDWHWLISPASWAGDWSALKGQDITFWYKTDKPSYSAIVKITTENTNRLVLNTIVSNTILPDDSVRVELEVFPPPQEGIMVTLSSDNESCISVPEQVMVPAGVSTVEVYFHAAEGASIGCQSVIEATYAGFLASRITMMVLDNYGIGDEEFADAVRIYPNPCKGSFTISCTPGNTVRQLVMYSISGNAVLHLSEGALGNTSIDVSKMPPGIYFLRIFVENEVLTSKIVLE